MNAGQQKRLRWAADDLDLARSVIGKVLQEITATGLPTDKEGQLEVAELQNALGDLNPLIVLFHGKGET